MSYVDRIGSSWNWSMSRARSVAVAAAAALVIAGCTPGASGPSESPAATSSGGATAAPTARAQGDLLTFAAAGPPAGLNPAKIGVGSSTPFLAPAYDSYTYQKPDGTFGPNLATNFGYVAGSSNKTFRMTLRAGVKYSDGAEFTAQSVVDNLLYQKNSKFPPSSFLAGIDTVAAVGPLDVEIKLTQSDPMLPQLFSQFWPQGFPFSPAAVKDPALLEKGTYGIGPYVLDASATVPNDTYTFVPNANYYDQTKINYKKLVIKVIADTNARLQALRTGQVDVMPGAAANVQEMQSAGLQVGRALARNVAIWIQDREGKVVKALGDVRVRQALNYAVDRAAVAKTFVLDYGKATSQPANAGYLAFDPALDNRYPYDPAKAKQLLADAGYPNGFEMTIVTVTPGQAQAQAIAGFLTEVGIKVVFFNDNTFAAQTGAKYPTMILSYAGPIEVLLAQAVLPTAPANPFKNQDPKLDSLIQEYRTSGTQASARAVNQFLTEQAWFLPVYDEEAIYFAKANVGGFQVTPAWQVLDPKEFFKK